jgi:hypothetical protein
MRVTRYDRVSAFMYSAVIMLILFVVFTLTRVRVKWEADEVLVPMQFSQSDGGYEDGVAGETLLVESPFEETPNPSPAEEMIDQVSMQEMLDNVVESSSAVGTRAANVVGSEFAVGNEGYNSGTPGSSHGTGRPLGTGGGYYGGTRTEERWIIRFAEGSSIDEYARQLDFFGIELGVLLPGRLVFMKNMSTSPTTREVTTGNGEERLYMTWQGGGTRKEADVKLFQRAGIDASQGTIFHFYPQATEQMLMTIEQQYAGRRTQEIRRTYFVVERGGDGFVFRVTRQVPIGVR